MTTREELFEKWYLDWEKDAPSLIGQRDFGGQVWQACAAHYEAERNALLACLAQKDAALKWALGCIEIDYEPDMADARSLYRNAQQALSLQPDNCRLVEVGSASAKLLRSTKYTQVEMELLSSDSPADTKLYTIVQEGVE